MIEEHTRGHIAADGAIATLGGIVEKAGVIGVYNVQCIGPDGKVKWEDTADNIVTNVGKDLALDTFLAGSAYTAAVYMGLANSSAASCTATDTMASKTTWLEVGGANAPTYTSPRKTPAWSSSASGSKSTSSAVAFAITSTGSVGGCFLVFGTGAVTTIDSTAGVLYSCGAFTGGTKSVSNGDTLNCQYTASL